MPTPPLPADALRWRCPSLPFTDTRDVAPAAGVVGQDAAANALRYGLSIHGPGQNVFVRGAPGTGRLTLIRQLLREVDLQLPHGRDALYLHDVERPDEPRLITVPPGSGRVVRDRLAELIRFLREDLSDLIQTERLLERTRRVELTTAKELQELTAPFHGELVQAGLALVQVQEDGEDPEPAVLPVIDGEPHPLEDLDALVVSGAITEGNADALRASADDFTARLHQVTARVTRIRKRAQRHTQRAIQEEVRAVLADATADIRRAHPELKGWLAEVVEDVARNLPLLQEDPSLLERYRANLLVAHEPGVRPVIEENVPTFQSLVGSVDLPMEGRAPHLGVHAGSLIRADGGCLILSARDLIEEPGAWSAVVRTLRSGTLELAPQDPPGTTQRSPGVKPQPIPVRLKVVLVGDSDLYYALDAADPDFAEQFKVLVDLDDVITRDAVGSSLYAQVIAGVARRESLPPFTEGAVRALVEFGARIAAEAGKLTARFARIADVAREAAFLCRQEGSAQVERSDVERAVREAKRRVDLPGRRFRERLARGVLRVATSGAVVGQLNGLAVIQAGPLTVGFPSRITAAVGPGLGGTVHIEREAELSGHIHTKGFSIVRGLLRNLLHTEHPLVFDGSVTHEQSYGGIDGDSASCAELVALISALTRIPARQGLAMTGAVDQLGNVLPIGAADEKIEGFFDTCAASGLDGAQGVIVPASNVGDLMLRHDVVEACRAGRFAVYGVDRVEQALELFLGRPAEAVLQEATRRAEALWRATRPEAAR